MSDIDFRFSRRQMVSAGIATAFAAAVRPSLGSEVVVTDTNGLDCGMASFHAGDIEEQVYYAKPVSKSSLPVVLVVQEIFGLHEHIRDVCRRLAKSGYFAIAPNLYQRQGAAEQVSDIDNLVKNIVSKVGDAQVFADLDAASSWAVAHGGDAKRMAITGFCWGGRITWLYCAHSKQMRAGVAWYGRLQGSATELQPYHPVDRAAHLECPVLGLYGALDQGIPQAQIDAMQSALAALKSPSEIHVYAKAGHGFNADYRPSYDAESAQDGWKRMLSWFQANGVA